MPVQSSLMPTLSTPMMPPFVRAPTESSISNASSATLAMMATNTMFGNAAPSVMTTVALRTGFFGEKSSRQVQRNGTKEPAIATLKAKPLDFITSTTE